MIEEWGVQLATSILFSWVGPVTLVVIITCIAGGFVGSYRLHKRMVTNDPEQWHKQFTEIVIRPVLTFFEVICNYTILLVVFREIPDCKRASLTLHQQAHSGSIVARWICNKLLNPNAHEYIYPSKKYHR